MAGTKSCVPYPLEVKWQRLSEGLEEAEGKEAYTFRTMNVIFHWQYSVVRCLISFVRNEGYEVIIVANMPMYCGL